MGNCCSVTLQLTCDDLISRCLDCTFGRAAYLCSTEKNLKSLTNALEELKALKNDVDRAEAQEQRRLDQVQLWMSRVKDIQVEVVELLADKDPELQKLCAGGCCSSSCKSSYEYGKKVNEKWKEVDDLILKGRTFNVAAREAPPPEMRQTEQTVGMESMIVELWKELEEPEVGIVGLYGMGGVGKTTLLDQIYNKYLDTPNDFDFIIWIPISRNHRIEKIQNEIGRKIGIFSDKWENKEERQKAGEILRALRRQKFVLLLDDVWEQVDLKRVGIPFPGETNWSKLIFTTRVEEVCSKMGGRKKRVKCLEEEEAWELFRKNVNDAEDVLSLDPEIPVLAKTVARKCAGLPLALKIIGRAMSCKKTAREWKDAIDVLRRSASKFEGMEKEVLHLLKLSYDNLFSDEVKACFLYCALFPEDFAIHKDELVYKWMGEEILKEYADVDGALNKGYTIIGTLVRSCLLEDIRGHVKMHDVIRDMALWLACELEETRDNFMVQAGHLLKEIPNVEKWEGVKKMSLMANDIENLDTIPSCPNLHTLFLSNNRLKMVAQNFFNSMSTLRVLDLSKNKDLVQLPSGISKLVSLLYLDLSETCIAALPIELKALVKLIYLNLEHTSELDMIPQNLLSSFSKLRVLRLYNSGTCKSMLGDNAHLESELQGLKHLDMLTFTIQTDLISERFFTSNKLLSCTRFLCLDGLSFLDISPLAYMKRAYSLTINSCDRLEYNLNVLSQSSFKYLEAVDVRDCPKLSDLTWLVLAPDLKTLSIRSCSNMTEIIQLEKLGEIAQVGEMNQFSKLDELILVSLPQLESIYGNKTLPFLYLKRIEARGCQNLKKLPLNLPKRDLVITGEEE
ncbi:probable disease resistance protein At5g63020 isoform X3 [Malus sylvestris]|uniref:probable disease resistance protein At5g63020 isoform X3 n=1 Tax=Malus sylvestris TaxID=3752 RepID=UPI0021AC6E31|nr:probable disease resistance protein At5g63020 isoform X3 [Malus sylvestris]